MRRSYPAIGCISPTALAQIERAKAVCRDCPVATQCLAWALQTRQDAGVWGGLTDDDERRALRRSRQRRNRSAS
ncbi:MAG: WhiB family transcriptional regulator [Egibacteraceae bacterium]